MRVRSASCGSTACIRRSTIRRSVGIVLSAIDQRTFMEAVAGADPGLIRTGIGLFVPGTPLASDVGVSMMQGPKDPAKLQAALTDAGLQGRGEGRLWAHRTSR